MALKLLIRAATSPNYQTVALPNPALGQIVSNKYNKNLNTEMTRERIHEIAVQSKVHTKSIHF